VATKTISLDDSRLTKRELRELREIAMRLDALPEKTERPIVKDDFWVRWARLFSQSPRPGF
jgi:hypothetical protein